MKRFRDPRWTLIIAFVAIMVLIPAIQTIRELTEENGSGVGALQVFSQTPTAANLRAFEDGLEVASWAAKASRPWYQFAHFKWLKDGGEKVVVGSSGWYFYKPGLNYMLARHEIVEGSRRTNDPIKAIVHFRDQLSSRGIKLLVMPVPNKESVYPDMLTTRAEKIPGMMNPHTKETLDKLAAQGVEVVDLFKEFRELRKKTASGNETPLYLAQDTHWSPAGVQVAARAAARRLQDLGWVSIGEVNYTNQIMPVQRLGDLVTMLQSPVIARSVVPENVQAVQVMDGDTKRAYEDKAEAQILILGDSFMRIYQQDAPTSAGFIAHFAREMRQPMLTKVNDGGGATLVREELAASPVLLGNKKVVLWEFVERDLGLALKGWPQVPIAGQ